MSDSFFEVRDGRIVGEIPADRVEVIPTGDPEAPVQFEERMSPFMRRLRDKNLPAVDNTGAVLWPKGAA